MKLTFTPGIEGRPLGPVETHELCKYLNIGMKYSDNGWFAPARKSVGDADASIVYFDYTAKPLDLTELEENIERVGCSILDLNSQPGSFEVPLKRFEPEEYTALLDRLHPEKKKSFDLRATLERVGAETVNLKELQLALGAGV